MLLFHLHFPFFWLRRQETRIPNHLLEITGTVRPRVRNQIRPRCSKEYGRSFCAGPERFPSPCRQMTNPLCEAPRPSMQQQKEDGNKINPRRTLAERPGRVQVSLRRRGTRDAVIEAGAVHGNCRKPFGYLCFLF